MKLLKLYQKYLKYVLVALIIAVGGIFYLVSHQQKGNHSEVISVTQGGQANNASDSLSGDTSSTELSANNATEQESEQVFYIYVCGEVVTPGVYQCKDGSRIFELIEMAGGFTETADTTYLNLVDKVTDGQKVFIPQLGENGSNVQNQTEMNSLININTASKEQLMSLPGIGESKANDIIQSRTTEGLFKSTEDIMRISGIKESAYGKLKDLISVG